MPRSPILSLRNISLRFGQNPVFSHLNLTFHQNDKLCLVGRNGSGKSTLMRIIAGLIEPDDGSIDLRPGFTVGYMDQHPEMSAYKTLQDYIYADMQEFEKHRIDMLSQNLKIKLSTPTANASGGECRRAALVKIMASAPDLMLLDEPTNHLDIEAIEWLENELNITKNAFIIISHDRAFLQNLTRATLWIDRGEIRQQSKGFENFENWRDKIFEDEDTQRHKLNRLIKSESHWAVEGISARRKRNQGRLRRLNDLKQHRREQIKRQERAALNFGNAPRSGKLVAELKNASKSFGTKVIADDFNLRITRGERVALVGPNGIGKTTVLKMITGDIKPDTGSLRQGFNVVSCIFDQNRSQLKDDQTLWQSLTEDPELGVMGKNDQIMVRGQPRNIVGYLKDFLFDKTQVRSPVSVLSGGEKARLLLARLMARHHNLLILDEPTNDLDIETLDILQEQLNEYDGTILLVSHDRDFLDRVATSTLVFGEKGRIISYAGGWSDYVAQRNDTISESTNSKTKPKKNKTSKALSTEKPVKLSYMHEKKLNDLPKEIEKIETEIKKLEEFLSDPELYTTSPEKFKKATNALRDRQILIKQKEDEWLNLLELSDDIIG